MSEELKTEKEKKKAQKEAEKIAVELRRERTMALHLSGASFRQIADQLSKGGTPVSKSTVEKDINLLLDRNAGESEKEIIRLRNKNKRRLESLILANWASATSGDLKKGYLVATLIKDLSELGGANKPIKFEHDLKFNPKELSDEELQRIANSSGKS